MCERGADRPVTACADVLPNGDKDDAEYTARLQSAALFTPAPLQLAAPAAVLLTTPIPDVTVVLLAVLSLVLRVAGLAAAAAVTLLGRVTAASAINCCISVRTLAAS